MSYDPFELPDHLEPYGTYAELRRAAPLYRNAERGFYALSRHADVQRAAHDHVRFSASRPEVREADAVFGIRGPEWVAGDSPGHAVLHRLMAPRLGRAAAGDLERLVGRHVAERVDRMVARREVDAVDELARPLPVALICDLWGFPAANRERLAELSDAVWRREPGLMALPPEVGPAYADFRAEVERIAAERPRGVLGSLLAAARAGRISASEVVDISVLVPATGFKTTTALIAAALMQLARHPAQQRRLLADPARAEGVVEEVLRFDPPVHWLPRVTTTAVALEHGTIPAGERVLLLLGSANRDPARFREPDRFDPSRTGRRHLAFGYGIHHCVGSILARMTARAVLERLCATTREFALDGPAARIFSSLGEREFARLPLRFTPR